MSFNADVRGGGLPLQHPQFPYGRDAPGPGTRPGLTDRRFVATGHKPCQRRRVVSRTRSRSCYRHLVWCAGCDIIFDCSRDDANTGTFYDYMTPQLILGPNNESRILRAWFNLTPNSFHGGSNGGRDDDAFTDAIEQMIASVGDQHGLDVEVGASGQGWQDGSNTRCPSRAWTCTRSRPWS